MPSFAEKARKAQADKRAGRDEKDPADLSGAEEPNWDDPDSWGGSGGSSGDSASGNDGETAGENDGPEQKADSGSNAPPPSAPRAPRRAPRRRGRPRGPDREMLSVRILAKNDRRLTIAVEQTGKNPQTIVDTALDSLFKRLKIEDPGAQEQAAHEDTA